MWFCPAQRSNWPKCKSLSFIGKQVHYQRASSWGWLITLASKEFHSLRIGLGVGVSFWTYSVKVNKSLLALWKWHHAKLLLLLLVTSEFGWGYYCMLYVWIRKPPPSSSSFNIQLKKDFCCCCCSFQSYFPVTSRENCQCSSHQDLEVAPLSSLLVLELFLRGPFTHTHCNISFSFLVK